MKSGFRKRLRRSGVTPAARIRQGGGLSNLTRAGIALIGVGNISPQYHQINLPKPLNTSHRAMAVQGHTTTSSPPIGPVREIAEP